MVQDSAIPPTRLHAVVGPNYGRPLFFLVRPGDGFDSNYFRRFSCCIYSGESITKQSECCAKVDTVESNQPTRKNTAGRSTPLFMARKLTAVARRALPFFILIAAARRCRFGPKHAKQTTCFESDYVRARNYVNAIRAF